MKIFEIEFLAPLYFMLILLVPVFLYFFYKKQKKSILFLFFEDLRKVFKRNNFWFYLKILVLI
jgi:hypothetical protein